MAKGRRCRRPSKALQSASIPVTGGAFSVYQAQVDEFERDVLEGQEQVHISLCVIVVANVGCAALQECLGRGVHLEADREHLDLGILHARAEAAGLRQRGAIGLGGIEPRMAA